MPPVYNLCPLPAATRTLNFHCTSCRCKMESRAVSLFFTIIYLLSGSRSVRAECDNVTVLSTQIDTLLAVQDREVPPDSTLLVSVGLDVRHATVNERDTSMRLLADLKIKWEDQRLKWNATEWNCSKWLTSAERLWLPDIMVLNAAATGAGESSLRASISSDGSVSWIKRLDISIPISLRLVDWPRDTQSCSIVFGSRMYSSNELNLIINDTKHALVFQSDSWEVTAVTGELSNWSRGDVDSLVASWTVSVQRRAPAHALAAGSVLCALLLVLVAGTALPPASRPPLAATAALIGAVWMTGTVGRLPGAASSPRVLALVSACCASAALSCACSALVVRVPAWTATPPRFLRSLLSKLSTVCDLTPHPQDSISCETSAAWAATARLLDRAHLAALYFTIIIIAALYFL